MRPKFVAIDTGLLNQLARDLFGEESEPRASVRAMIEWLGQNAWIPLITWHHFEELIRHRDESVASDRIGLLRSLSQLAWLTPLHRPDSLATIVDLLAYEVRGIVGQTCLSLGALIGFVRESLLRVGQPEDMPCLQDWREIRPLLLSRPSREQEIASIAHTAIDESLPRSLAALRGADLRSIDEVRQLFQEKAKTLSDQLALRGDRRLVDRTRSAKRFFMQRLRDHLEMRSVRGDAVDRFLSAFDLSRADVSEDTPMDEVERLAALRLNPSYSPTEGA